MAKGLQGRLGNRISDDIHHWVFRVVAIAFTGGSAYSFYWIVGAHSSDVVWRYIVMVLTVAFALYGYFAVRGLAYRMMQKKRVLSYVIITAVYLFVEISCNLMHAVAGYPGVDWLQSLSGEIKNTFSVLWVVVTSMFPVLNGGLGLMDSDMEQEKQKDLQAVGGVVSAGVVPPVNRANTPPPAPPKAAPGGQPQPKQAPVGQWGGSAPTVPLTAAYPTQSGQGNNGMQTHYNGARQVPQMVMNGASSSGN